MCFKGRIFVWSVVPAVELAKVYATWPRSGDGDCDTVQGINKLWIVHDHKLLGYYNKTARTLATKDVVFSESVLKLSQNPVFMATL